jgi:glucose-6-phosphate-specific signal transduction histidine kinase
MVMGTRSRWETGWHYVIGTLAYAACVALFRWFIVPHWLIVCGLTFSALLLVPYRYWPCLFVGESLTLLHTSITCVGQLGLAFSVVNLIPSSLLVAPIVYWSRERWPVLSRGHLNMSALLGCGLLVSTVMTLNSVGILAVERLPPGYVLHWGEVLARWMLGNYIGILCIVPTVLVFQQAAIKRPWRTWGGAILDSKLLLESIGLAAPVVGLLVWVGLSASPHTNTRQIAQIALFLPIVWLALRHGWQGAALGGTVASFAIIALMPEKHDQNTMQAEVLVAFVISTMLLVGGRITAMDRQAEKERTDVRMALALAQRNVHVGEMHLRMTSMALEQIRENVQAGFAMMMGRLRHLQPAVDDGGYRKQALVTQDQITVLADGLYPSAWRERGLPGALQDSAVARALREGGMGYRCDLRGPISALPQALRVAIYRSVNEAISDVIAKRNTSDIFVQVRCGEQRRRRWVVASVSFRAQPVRVKHVEWDHLLPKVIRTTSGLGWAAIQGRSETYEGRARERMTTNGRRITMSFHEPLRSGDT